MTLRTILNKIGLAICVFLIVAASSTLGYVALKLVRRIRPDD